MATHASPCISQRHESGTDVAASGWFASMLAGAVFVEYVFRGNGMGLLMFRALEQGDLPVVMGGVLLVATTFVAVNVLVDVMYSWLDPVSGWIDGILSGVSFNAFESNLPAFRPWRGSTRLSVTGHPFDATHRVGEEELVGLEEGLGCQGGFINLYSVVHGRANEHGSHDAPNTSIVQTRGVEHPVGHDKQIGP